MTNGKTIALTRRTFVGKVMSLLFNMLSRLVITFKLFFFFFGPLGSHVGFQVDKKKELKGRIGHNESGQSVCGNNGLQATRISNLCEEFCP